MNTENNKPSNDSESLPKNEATQENDEALEASDLKEQEPNPQEEINALKDRLLRANAEAENLRKRAERQVSDAANYAVTSFARELLSVSDNLRRALDSFPKDDTASEALTTFLEGVEMTERELLNVFEKQGIKKLNPEGEKFDHNFHQAMFEAEDPNAEPGDILQVIQPGYVLKDRLLRPAMVGVNKRSAAPKPDEGGEVDETV